MGGPLTPYPGFIDCLCLRSRAHRCHCFEQVELRCSPSARQCVISRGSQLPAVESDSLTRINKVPVNSEETVSRLNLQRVLNTRRNARAFSFWIYSNRSQLFHDSFRWFCHLRRCSAHINKPHRCSSCTDTRLSQTRSFPEDTNWGKHELELCLLTWHVNWSYVSELMCCVRKCWLPEIG